MNDISRQGDKGVQEDYNNDNNKEDDDDDGKEEKEYEDSYSGTALPNLEGSSISSINDLIGFAQARACKKAKDSKGDGVMGTGIDRGTWENKNWAWPVPHVDKITGEQLDINDLLEGGIVEDIVRALLAAERVTVPHTCKRQEALATATTHGKKFFVPESKHITPDNMFKAVEISSWKAESVEREMDR
jgi:hypothetical protein